MTIAKRRSERGWDTKKIDKRVVGDEGPAAMAWEVAATANDAKARYRLGKMHRTIASYSKERLAEEMTPDQITEAERLVREWKSDPASCDLEVNQVASE